MHSRFAEKFEQSVMDTVRTHSLASKADKILVACSGGKDSTSVLYILHKNGYDVEALHIDLGIGRWSEKNHKNISSFCRDGGIKFHLASTRDFFGTSVCYLKSSLQTKTDLTSCSICGVIKKWILNKKARELGADRLATGHNLDDEARTFMMNVINGNPELCLYSSPGRGSISGLFVPRIKPLYFTPASRIERYSKEMGFPVLYERCPCSKGSFGRNIYDEMGELEKHAPKLKINVVRAFLALQKKAVGDLAKEVTACGLCGEPSKKGICRTCSMLSVLTKRG
jgi:uncharacterized protein (TIGR00269 family)